VECEEPGAKEGRWDVLSALALPLPLSILGRDMASSSWVFSCADEADKDDDEEDEEGKTVVTGSEVDMEGLATGLVTFEFWALLIDTPGVPTVECASVISD